MRSHYELMGIDESASVKEINAAYRKLAKKFHPDAETGDAQTFQQISEAYNALKTDAENRSSNSDRALVRTSENRSKQKRKTREKRATLPGKAFGVLLSVAFYLLGIITMYFGMVLHSRVRVAIVGIGLLISVFGFTVYLNRARHFPTVFGIVPYSFRHILSVFTGTALTVFRVGLLAFAITVTLAAIDWGNRTFAHILPTKIWHN